MTGSKTAPQRFPASEKSTAATWEAVERDGAAVIEGFLPPEVRHSLDEELEPHLERVVGGSMIDEFADKQSHTLPRSLKWLTNLAVVSKTFREELLNHTILHAICRHAFRPFGDYWMLTGMAMAMQPGNPEQTLHRDDGTHTILAQLKADAPVVAVTIIIALTDFTAANGATQIIPGSHRWAEVGAPSSSQAIPVTMKAGDVLVMRQGLVHGASRHDETAGPRRMLLMQMATCQLAPFEAYLAVPRPIVESLTPLAQKMIGWRSMKPALSSCTGLSTVQMRHLENEIGLKSRDSCTSSPIS